jgi:HEAT repeat protein
LRRLLASDAEAAEVRVAAMRLLELTPGTDHFPALESALSDAHEGVRTEAFRVLSSSGADRASEVLARGIARAEPGVQATLLGQLRPHGAARLLPVLRHLVPQFDPQAAPVPACLLLLALLEQAGGADAHALIGSVIARTHWRTPLRTWRIRVAANAALRALRQGADPAAPPGPAPGAPSSPGVGP